MPVLLSESVVRPYENFRIAAWWVRVEDLFVEEIEAGFAFALPDAREVQEMKMSGREGGREVEILVCLRAALGQCQKNTWRSWVGDPEILTYRTI
jgi:hypothetical protein